MNIREPAVANMFYPGNADELQFMVNKYLERAKDQPVAPRAIIVPHAGYVYSGEIAASAYKLLSPIADKIKRVVLLGPSHRVAFSGCALSSADYFRTPLGMVSIDQKANVILAKLPQILVYDLAHLQEHSLEVHLPFLQTVLGDFRLVPIVVGDCSARNVAEVLDVFWNDNETLYVISSDLSHYHPYQIAKQIDQKTSDAIINLHPEDIGYEQACGRNPVNGLLNLAKKHGLNVKNVDLRNSGDTAGSKDQVVGYGSYVFY